MNSQFVQRASQVVGKKQVLFVNISSQQQYPGTLVEWFNEQQTNTRIGTIVATEPPITSTIWQPDGPTSTIAEVFRRTR